MVQELAIEIEKTELEVCLLQSQEHGVEIESFEPKRFDGGASIVTVVLPLAATTLPFITKIVIEQIKAKRHIKVKISGVEIQGLSAKDAHIILNNILDSKKNAKP